MISRHIARFSGENGYDPRAEWVSWPELVRLAEEDSTRPLFERLASRKISVAQKPNAPLSSHIELEGLTVEFVQDGFAEEPTSEASDQNGSASTPLD